MRTDTEIIRDLMNDYALTFEEKTRIVDWAKNCLNCLNGNGNCVTDCPLNTPDVNCVDFFAKFIATRGTLIPAERDVSSLIELANNCIKICNEIKIKTKRETPMQVVVSHSNGKTIYHCYNCGKPLFIQPSTQYCECCGQKLSFEVVENEI